jgi:L-lactate dehydrogenase complex protein LldF
VRIDLPSQLLMLRRDIAQKGGSGRFKRRIAWLSTQILMRPTLYRTAGRTVRWFLRHAPRFLLYHRWNRWTRQRDLPLAPRSSFRDSATRLKGATHKKP